MDDEVGATGERQQNIEQSNSGDQRKERAAAVTRDYGAITDTDELVRIMGRGPFRRPVFSL